MLEIIHHSAYYAKNAEIFIRLEGSNYIKVEFTGFELILGI